ncbi:MAG: hypothetical protein AB7E42_09535 [Anaerotignaceae bacterium]
MKIYSWKDLLVSIFGGGGAIIYILLHFNEVTDFFYLIIFAYLVLKGISISISKEEYDKEKKREAKMKRVYRKLFGKFEPVAPYGGYILIALGCAVALLFPEVEWVTEWLLLILILSALAYNIWLAIIIKKHMKIEEAQEIINSEKIQ